MYLITVLHLQIYDRKLKGINISYIQYKKSKYKKVCDNLIYLVLDFTVLKPNLNLNHKTDSLQIKPIHLFRLWIIWEKKVFFFLQLTVFIKTKNILCDRIKICYGPLTTNHFACPKNFNHILNILSLIFIKYNLIKSKCSLSRII